MLKLDWLEKELPRFRQNGTQKLHHLWSSGPMVPGVYLELTVELGVITDINVGRSFGNIKVLESCCGQARCSREFPWTF